MESVNEIVGSDGSVLKGYEEKLDDHQGMPKGDATGQPTDTVEVPFDEIEDAQGNLVSPSQPAKKAAKKAKKRVAKKTGKNPTKHPRDPEVDRKIYEARAKGSDWDDITSDLGIKSPWSLARRHAKANGLPYPPIVVESSDNEESEPEPQKEDLKKEGWQEPPPPEPPVAPMQRTESYTIKMLKDHPEIEKVVSGQIAVLQFKIGQRLVTLSLQEIPTENQANRMIERELRRAGVLK